MNRLSWRLYVSPADHAVYAIRTAKIMRCVGHLHIDRDTGAVTFIEIVDTSRIRRVGWSRKERRASNPKPKKEQNEK